MIETHVVERLKETCQIWEKALAEISAVGQNVKLLMAKIDLLAEDVLNVLTKQRESDLRLKELESLLHRA